MTNWSRSYTGSSYHMSATSRIDFSFSRSMRGSWSCYWAWLRCFSIPIRTRHTSHDRYDASTRTSLWTGCGASFVFSISSTSHALLSHRYISGDRLSNGYSFLYYSSLFMLVSFIVIVTFSKINTERILTRKVKGFVCVSPARYWAH